MRTIDDLDGLDYTLTTEADPGVLLDDGRITTGVSSHYSVVKLTVSEYASEDPKAIFIYGPSIPVTSESSRAVTAVAFDQQMNVLGSFSAESNDDQGWIFPVGTAIIYLQTEDPMPNFRVATGQIISVPISYLKIYTANGDLVGNYSGSNFYIESLPDADVIIGGLRYANTFSNGQYYAEISDGTNTWYSEVFTVVNDIDPYLKIEWWDEEDFIMDAGVIVYNGYFKNAVYLPSDLAKPEYEFEEEGEARDGYFFPIKQISQKMYRFRFLASEYLLDVMRFIRMADHIQITYHGQVYYPDTFLITPEWEGNGDIANVEAEFTTSTVAKKIGKAYTRAQS